MASAADQIATQDEEGLTGLNPAGVRTVPAVVPLTRWPGSRFHSHRVMPIPWSAARIARERSVLP